MAFVIFNAIMHWVSTSASQLGAGLYWLTGVLRWTFQTMSDGQKWLNGTPFSSLHSCSRKLYTWRHHLDRQWKACSHRRIVAGAKTRLCEPTVSNDLHF